MTMNSLDHNPKDKAKYMIQAFNAKFTIFSLVTTTQAQAKHDAQLFDTI